MLWTKAMECGIATVDEQHKQLFRQVDRLLNGDGPDRVNETLRFLQYYVVKHFNTEEILHAKTNYPGAAAHKRMHEDFTNAFLKLKREYDQSGYSLSILLKLNRVAVEWLQQHILGADMDFGVYNASLAESTPSLQPA